MSGPGPIPFRRDVPIIGQPFTIRAWWPTAMLNCNCESKHALLLQGFGQVTICPDCHKAFVIERAVQDPQTGQVGLQVSHVIIQPGNPGASA